MAEENKFLSYRDFSNYANVSLQAVYKRAKQLQESNPDYFIKEGNTYRISINAKELFNQRASQLSQSKDKELNELKTLYQQSIDNINILENKLKSATGMIIDKDKELLELKAELDKLQAIISEKNELIRELKADKENLYKQMNEIKQSFDNTIEQVNNTLQIEQRRYVALLEDSQKKKGLFSRIFKKDTEIIDE